MQLSQTLHHIGNGSFITEAETELQNLIRTVEETGKTGNIALIISAKKVSRAGAMQIGGKVKITLPKVDPHEALLWPTPDGDLVADDPSQQKLDLKQVPAGSTELRKVS